MSVKVDLPDWLTMCLMPQIEILSEWMDKYRDFDLMVTEEQFLLTHKNSALTYWNKSYPGAVEDEGKSKKRICAEYQSQVCGTIIRIVDDLRTYDEYVLLKRENPLLFELIKQWERSIRELYEVYPVLDLSFRYTFLGKAMCFYCECSVREWKKSFVSEMFYDTTVDGVIALEKLRMRRFLQAVIEKGEQLRERM